MSICTRNKKKHDSPMTQIEWCTSQTILPLFLCSAAPETQTSGQNKSARLSSPTNRQNKLTKSAKVAHRFRDGVTSQSESSHPQPGKPGLRVLQGGGGGTTTGPDANPPPICLTPAKPADGRLQVQCWMSLTVHHRFQRMRPPAGLHPVCMCFICPSSPVLSVPSPCPCTCAAPHLRE